MPIYEYRCKHCGDEFDDLVRMDTPDEDVACPKCGQHQAQRHMSAVAGIVSGGTSVAAM
ncbi:MAG: zinc ribbon domain-containing protein, partial [Oligoflexia bacterium]|nr:zinc ribbon domain-containing protein [Oligoflexia bacterium]